MALIDDVLEKISKGVSPDSLTPDEKEAWKTLGKNPVWRTAYKQAEKTLKKIIKTDYEDADPTGLSKFWRDFRELLVSKYITLKEKLVGSRVTDAISGSTEPLETNPSFIHAVGHAFSRIVDSIASGLGKADTISWSSALPSLGIIGLIGFAAASIFRVLTRKRTRKGMAVPIVSSTDSPSADFVEDEDDDELITRAEAAAKELKSKGMLNKDEEDEEDVAESVNAKLSSIIEDLRVFLR